MLGRSQPYLMVSDQVPTYVVKFRNIPFFNQNTANEMIASRLAALIQLPVPGRAFVQVSQGLISGTPLLRFETTGRKEQCAAGVHFGSRFPGVPSQTLVVDFLPDRLLRRVTNLAPIFVGAYVLDKWTCNCDGRQVIFYRASGDGSPPYSALRIDQGFCFNDGEWNFPDSPIRCIYPRRLVYESVRGFQSFEPFLSLVENLEAHQIDACLEDIPGEWCGERPKEIHRLAEQLFNRRRRVRQELVDAKNSDLQPFPNWPR